MDQAEYDRQFKRAPGPRGIMTQGGDDPLGTQEIIVGGQSVAPLHITYVQRTPTERNQRHHEEIGTHEEIVGYIGHVPLVRRRGGADYAGREQWEQLMRRAGRLRR